MSLACKDPLKACELLSFLYDFELLLFVMIFIGTVNPYDVMTLKGFKQRILFSELL